MNIKGGFFFLKKTGNKFKAENKELRITTIFFWVFLITNFFLPINISLLILNQQS